jgi:hypothetical protein
MKKWYISLIFLLLPLLADARKPVPEVTEQDKTVRRLVGFQPGEKAFELLLGQPSGFRYQNYLSSKTAYNADIAYHTKEQILGQINYVFYYYDARDKLKSQDFWNSAYFYYGPGMVLGKEVGDDEDDFLFGARAFVGLDYIFVNSAYAIRTELAAVAYLSGDDGIGAQLFIGLSYHWDRKRKRFYRKLDESSEN